VDETGRESGLLIPVLSNSSIKGFIVGEQVYWVINRSMDMVAGAELYSKRGWAPNGDFRYKGRDSTTSSCAGMPCSTAASSSRLATHASLTAKARRTLPGPVGYELVNQGGVDVVAEGRKDSRPHTHAAGTVEYLSSYLYRLVFNDNFSQAISSEVASDVSLTHATTDASPPSRWTASRPLPARPTATRPGFSTCPACATTCSTGP
jgi:LPS-assembly protein